MSIQGLGSSDQKYTVHLSAETIGNLLPILNTKLHGLKTELASKTGALGDLVKKVRSCEKALQEAQHTLEKAIQRVEQRQQSLSKAETERATAAKENDKCSREIALRESEISGLQASLSTSVLPSSMSFDSSNAIPSPVADVAGPVDPSSASTPMEIDASSDRDAADLLLQLRATTPLSAASASRKRKKDSESAIPNVLLQAYKGKEVYVVQEGKNGTVEAYDIHSSTYKINIDGQIVDKKNNQIYYKPKDNEIFLIKEEYKKDPSQLYYKARISERLPNERSHARINIHWEDFGTQSKQPREYFTLDTIIPLGENNEILEHLDQKPIRDASDPDHPITGVGYKLPRSFLAKQARSTSTGED